MLDPRLLVGRGPIRSPMSVRPSVSRLVSYHIFSKTGHEIVLIFCMKLDIDNRKKLTKPFLAKNSGSLIIHENVSKNEEKKLVKKIENFLGQTVFDFGRQ